jgi:hypothetical protein
MDLEVSFWGKNNEKLIIKNHTLIQVLETEQETTTRQLQDNNSKLLPETKTVKVQDSKGLRFIEKIPKILVDPLTVHNHTFLKIGYISMMQIKDEQIVIKLPKNNVLLRKLFNFIDLKKASMKIPVSDYFIKLPVYDIKENQTIDKDTKFTEKYFLKIPNVELTDNIYRSIWCGFLSASIRVGNQSKYMSATFSNYDLFFTDKTKLPLLRYGYIYKNSNKFENTECIYNLFYDQKIMNNINAEFNAGSYFLQNIDTLFQFVQDIGCLKPNMTENAYSIYLNKCKKIRNIKECKKIRNIKECTL